MEEIRRDERSKEDGARRNDELSYVNRKVSLSMSVFGLKAFGAGGSL